MTKKTAKTHPALKPNVRCIFSWEGPIEKRMGYGFICYNDGKGRIRTYHKDYVDERIMPLEPVEVRSVRQLCRLPAGKIALVSPRLILKVLGFGRGGVQPRDFAEPVGLTAEVA